LNYHRSIIITVMYRKNVAAKRLHNLWRVNFALCT